MLLTNAMLDGYTSVMTSESFLKASYDDGVASV